MGKDNGDYIVISPVKDECSRVEQTIQSMVAQTVKPVQWVIVDDGSTDGTAALLSRYSKVHPWIRVVTRDSNVDRAPGGAVIRAFVYGLSTIAHLKFDYIVKLDADLALPTDYFEKLLLQFEEDPRLGIASGAYLEEHGGKWVKIWMPQYHAAGASKMVRTKCFEDIGGFITERGWDTVDEIRAQSLGWRTRHFDNLEFLHLKAEGSGIGRPRTDFMLGEIYYRTGGGLLFFSLKVIHRMATHRPLLLSGICMLYGFIRESLSSRPRLVTDAEGRMYRKLLNSRIKRSLARLLPWSHKTARQPWGFA